MAVFRLLERKRVLAEVGVVVAGHVAGAARAVDEGRVAGVARAVVVRVAGAAGVALPKKHRFHHS